MAAVANFNIDQGTTFSSTVTVKDSTGNPLDLTGYTGTAMMKKHAASLRNTATFTVAFPNRAAGQVKISLGATTTSALKPGRYVYDLLLNDGSVKTRVVEGSAIVTAGVTTS